MTVSSPLREEGPRPTVEPPDMDEYLESTIYEDELSQAIDGCEGLEMDGTCPHGLPTWERYWGVI